MIRSSSLPPPIKWPALNYGSAYVEALESEVRRLRHLVDELQRRERMRGQPYPFGPRGPYYTL